MVYRTYRYECRGAMKPLEIDLRHTMKNTLRRILYDIELFQNSIKTEYIHLMRIEASMIPPHSDKKNIHRLQWIQTGINRLIMLLQENSGDISLIMQH